MTLILTMFVLTLSKLSEITQLPQKEIEDITDNNVRKVFGI
ncbi:MAG: hypothetical protein U9R01_07630 [candidate division WOR-3 bacterium]|nr:hypothetical protein [candidate division WOR-3 bacterium]